MYEEVIFGAGKIGLSYLRTMGKERIFCFIDNDISKHGTEIDGVPVISLQEYVERNYQKKIIICTMYQYTVQIMNQLENAGIVDYKVHNTQLFENIDLIDWGNNNEISEDLWDEMYASETCRKSIRNYVEQQGERVPLFHEIEIETINRCNGVCSFCPVNRNTDKREKKIMDKKLFEKIINELSDLDFCGRIALFSNNEPFLDDRIVEFHKYAREKLPKAQFHLFTNGTLLSLELFLDVIEYLDELIIDNYNMNLELISNVKKIKDYIDEKKDLDLRKKVKILVRRPNEVLSSRGGEAPNKKCKVDVADETCALPFCQMIVRPTGEVSLCCNDALGKMTLGDVNTDSLVDIWYGEKYNRVREQLKMGRAHIPQCKNCDTFMTI